MRCWPSEFEDVAQKSRASLATRTLTGVLMSAYSLAGRKLGIPVVYEIRAFWEGRRSGSRNLLSKLLEIQDDALDGDLGLPESCPGCSNMQWN